MLDRADSIESDLNGLVEEFRSSVTVLVSTLRDGAGGLRTNLEEVRAGLSDVSAAGGVAPPAEPEVEEEVEEASAEAAHEAAPEVEEAETSEAEPEEADQTELAEEAEAEEAPAEEAAAEPEAAPEPEEAPEPTPPAAEGEGAEGARLIALNMALNGTPREETARYLQENFDLQNTDSILDEVYARVGG